MCKTLLKLSALMSLLLFGLAGSIFLLENNPWPAKAKEVTKIVTVYRPDDPSARPALAGFEISINQIVASGLTRPVQVTHAGDGSGRLFVVEQDGRIKIIKNGSVLSTAFLDINTIVRGPTEGGSEEGLLGLAFHPNYKTNGHFYVYYTDNSSNIAIARYITSPPNSDTANAGSASIILPISHPGQTNHNGGQLAFGPVDGYLYISTGDGGGGNDGPNNAQNINKLLGKILRLNVTGVATYTIPPDNPYAGPTSGNDEIWALGLRNPWRFSFDRGSSNGDSKGDLYIGDVGQGSWEEISYQAAGTLGGLNFGWRCKEATHINTNNNIDQQPPCDNAAFLAGLTDPIAEYSNPTLGTAVTGGFVYRGNLYAALAGYYFYADFGSGRIWSMRKTSPNSWSTPEQELDTSINISAFGEDEQGELYVVDYSGKIRRLADATGAAPLISTYLPMIFK